MSYSNTAGETKSILQNIKNLHILKDERTKLRMKTMNYIVTLLAMVAVGAYAAPSKRNNEQACGSKPAELFFLLDSSSSIWGLDFKKQLVFVNDVIDSFTIGPNATRVGVASFSYGYYPNFDLDAYDNKDDIKAAVSGIRHKLGGTYTYDALDGVRTSGLSKDRSRPGVARILVVLTDGESHNERKTKEAAMKLKEDGVVVFAVGIGSNTDKVELEAIASEPKDKYLFEVTSYGLLETIKESLFIKACEVDDAPAGPACGLNNPADIMFLVDPAEIGAAHTSVVFDYISELLPEFNMEKDHIKVGVESQNCGAKSIPLGFYEDKSKMEKVLRNSQVSGLAHMLKRLRTHSYRPENGGRDYARHMAVLFVDDKLYDSKTILDEAKRSKNYDVEIFVVAIGDSVVDDELTTLCSSTVNRHLIRVPSYADLKSSKPEFLEKFCQGL